MTAMTGSRVRDIESALSLVSAWRAAGERIVLVRGSLDLLSAAHARLIGTARRGTRRLIVAIRDDHGAARVLGSGRPIEPAAERARVAAALRGVDAVVIADDAAALALVDAIGTANEIVDADAEERSDVRERVLKLHGRG